MWVAEIPAIPGCTRCDRCARRKSDDTVRKTSVESENARLGNICRDGDAESSWRLAYQLRGPVSLDGNLARYAL